MNKRGDGGNAGLQTGTRWAAPSGGRVSPLPRMARSSESDESGPPRRLSVFTRVPVPGATKTRLTPPLTPEQAAALQRAMTEDLLERFARECSADDRDPEQAADLSLEVRCDGDPSRGALDIPAAWTVSSQGAGDLGERLARAARDARRDGVDRLVIIGSDAPLLPTALVEAAFSELASREAVLAPAEDGGYVLIAVAVERAPEIAVERLFSGIPWGTGAVRQATADAAGRAGLRFGELPSHWDVDRPEDLPRLAAAIRALDRSARPRRTAALVIGDAL